MIQFYKKRNFSELISDTLLFFKLHGKNYFKNYFLLNGILLIVMVMLMVFGYRELFSQIFGSNLGGESFYFENYFEENFGILIVVTALVFLVFFLITILNYLFPVFYLKRLAETGNPNIRADEILTDVKNNLGRFIIFFLAVTFIVMPLYIIVFGITYILIIVLIGLLLMLLIMPVLMNIFNFLLYDYFGTKRGFFNSLSYAIRSQFAYSQGFHKSPFWKYWGSSTILYMIIQTVVGVITMIPMILIFSSTIISAQQGSGSPFSDGAAILIFVCYAISILISFIAGNMISVNAGLMYYDSRLDLHRKDDFNEIDSIGNA